MQDVSEVLADHYQKTYELTHEMWKQRNKIFLMLVGTIGVATLLTFRIQESEPLLVDVIAKLLSLADDRRKQMYKSFPFDVLQGIFVLVVFYLMVNLYHRALYVLHNYKYLEALEVDLRGVLKLPPENRFFTREGKFYWGSRNKSKPRGYILGSVKFVYILLLGLLLFAFLIQRLAEDYSTQGKTLVAVAETLIAIPIAVYFIEYAIASITLDAASMPAPHLAVVASRSGSLDSFMQAEMLEVPDIYKKNGHKDFRVLGKSPMATAGSVFLTQSEVNGKRYDHNLYFFEGVGEDKILISSTRAAIKVS